MIRRIFIISAILLGGIFLPCGIKFSLENFGISMPIPQGKLFIAQAAVNLDVVINEIAWMGGSISANDEWLEFFNNTTSTVDLSGWKLKMVASSSTINLTGTIAPSGYYLMERTNDESVSGVVADLIYTGALSNSGEILALYDQDDNLIDRVDCSAGWFAGDSTSRKTMERKNSLLAATADNWQTSDLVGGTPKATNSLPPALPPADNNQNNNQNNSGSNQNYNYRASDIVINEFFSSPPAGQKEWLELYSNRDSSIDLNGWQIVDGSGAVTSLSGVILPQQFFIVESPKGNLNNSGDLIILKDNDGRIIDQVAYGNWLDGQNNAPLSDRESSTARQVDGADTNNDKTDFSQTFTVTREAPNIILAAEDLPSDSENQSTDEDRSAAVTSSASFFGVGDILINEFVADPAEDENEWVEFYNNTSTIIELAGWQVEDGTKTPTKLAGVLAPKQFLAIDDPKGKLNNPGDIIILRDPSGKIIDAVIYGKWDDGNLDDNAPPAKKLFSVARLAGANSGNNKNDFAVTASTTKSLANVIVAASEEKSTAAKNQSAQNSENNAAKTATAKTATVKKAAATIIDIELENIRDLKVGDKVRTRGLVAVEPGVLGAQFFYLTGPASPNPGNGGSGIQIYSYKKDFPDLKVGNLVAVTGEISESGGERRIKTTTKADLKILEGTAKPIEPHQITLAEVGEEYEGSLVKIEGEVIEVKGSNISLDDGSDEALVYIKKSTGINFAAIKEGDLLSVMGIGSQTTSGYRVLPRYQSDLEIKKGAVLGAQAENQTVASEPKNQLVNYLWAVIVFMGLIIIYLATRKFKVVKK